jgi:hypothetical protein
MRLIKLAVALGISIFGWVGHASDADSDCASKIKRSAMARAQSHFNLEPLHYLGTEQFGDVFRVKFHYRNCEVWSDVTISPTCNILEISLDSDPGGGSDADPLCR